MKTLKIGILVDSRAKRIYEELMFVLRENDFDLNEIILIKIERGGGGSIIRKILSFAKRCLLFVLVRGNAILRKILGEKKPFSSKELAEMFRKAGLEIPESALAKDLPVKTSAKIYEICAPSMNSLEVVNFLKNSKTEHFVFYSSELVKKPLFESGKKFLLCHPGKLPAFRGRDAMIWMMLKTGSWTWSAIYLNAGVDTGDVILTHSQKIPEIHVPIEPTKRDLKATLSFVQGIYNCRIGRARTLTKALILLHENNYRHIGQKQPDVPAGEMNRQYFFAAPEVNLLAMKMLFKIGNAKEEK